MQSTVQSVEDGKYFLTEKKTLTQGEEVMFCICEVICYTNSEWSVWVFQFWKALRSQSEEESWSRVVCINLNSFHIPHSRELHCLIMIRLVVVKAGVRNIEILTPSKGEFKKILPKT